MINVSEHLIIYLFSCLIINKGNFVTVFEVFNIAVVVVVFSQDCD